MKTKDEDFVDQLFIASTHSYILIFTDRGRVYWLKVHEIPEVGPQGKGKAIVNLVHLQAGGEDRRLRAPSRSFDAGRYVLLATRKGIVKKTELSAFSNPRPGGIIALGVEDDDALIEAVLTSRQGRDPARHPRRHGHPLQRGGRAPHGPRRLRREGHRAREGRRGGGARGGGGGGHRAHR